MRTLFVSLLSLCALALTGCSGERDAGDGQPYNAIILPTDVVLNLACEDVGVHPETCVLEDPENPFATVPISEFNINNPNAPFNKFDLAFSIPAGPTGAKARFYVWATALARFPSGENQYYTALALHELFDANSTAINEEIGSVDELTRAQALKAYKSVLDNFFGSITVQTCRVVDGCNPPVNFFLTLNERVADNLYRTEATGWRRLVDGIDLAVIELLLDWGYQYDPCTDIEPAVPGGKCTNGVVTVTQGP